MNKVNKEIDAESKRRRSTVEKEKSSTQKRYNKLLKKAEKEGFVFWLLLNSQAGACQSSFSKKALTLVYLDLDTARYD